MSDQAACERHKDCGLTAFDCAAAQAAGDGPAGVRPVPGPDFLVTIQDALVSWEPSEYYRQQGMKERWRERLATRLAEHLAHDGFCVVPRAVLYEHADGNPGDGCMALYEAYSPAEGAP